MKNKNRRTHYIERGRSKYSKCFRKIENKSNFRRREVHWISLVSRSFMLPFSHAERVDDGSLSVKNLWSVAVVFSVVFCRASIKHLVAVNVCVCVLNVYIFYLKHHISILQISALFSIHSTHFITFERIHTHHSSLIYDVRRKKHKHKHIHCTFIRCNNV